MEKSTERKFHIIYKTTCLETGKWYVGMHSTDNLNDGYLGSGVRLQRSIKKYGASAHKIEILEYAESRENLRIREEEILSEEFISDPFCMNISFSTSAGNDPGFWAKKDRTETSQKLSEILKATWAKRKADPEKMASFIAKNYTAENIKKRSEALKAKGHKRTPAQLKKLAEGQAAYYSAADSDLLKIRGAKSAVTRAIRGNANGGRPVGIPMSEEQKIRQSEQSKGKKKSEGLGQKVSRGLKKYFESIDKEILKERSRKGSAARSASLKAYYQALTPEARLARDKAMGKCRKIQSEDGSIIEIYNFAAFCAEHNIKQKQLHATTLNKRYVGGFRLL